MKDWQEIPVNRTPDEVCQLADDLNSRHKREIYHFTRTEGGGAHIAFTPREGFVTTDPTRRELGEINVFSNGSHSIMRVLPDDYGVWDELYQAMQRYGWLDEQPAETSDAAAIALRGANTQDEYNKNGIELTINGAPADFAALLDRLIERLEKIENGAGWYTVTEPDKWVSDTPVITVRVGVNMGSANEIFRARVQRSLEKNQALLTIGLNDWSHAEPVLDDLYIEMARFDYLVDKVEARRQMGLISDRSALIAAGQTPQTSVQRVSVDVGGGHAVVGYDDNPMIQALIAGELPQANQYQPWTPFYEFHANATRDQLLGVLGQLFSHYRTRHPEWLNRLSLRPEGRIAIVADDFWPIVDIDIVQATHRSRVSLTSHNYPDEKHELGDLSQDLAGYLRAELSALYEQPDKPAEPSARETTRDLIKRMRAGDGEAIRKAQAMIEAVEREANDPARQSLYDAWSQLEKSPHPGARAIIEALGQLPDQEIAPRLVEAIRKQLTPAIEITPQPTLTVTGKDNGRQAKPWQGSGQPPKTRAEKVAAIQAWDNLSELDRPLLAGWLETNFGANPDGSLAVAESTFHGWRNLKKAVENS